MPGVNENIFEHTDCEQASFSSMKKYKNKWMIRRGL